MLAFLLEPSVLILSVRSLLRSVAVTNKIKTNRPCRLVSLWTVGAAAAAVAAAAAAVVAAGCAAVGAGGLAAGYFQHATPGRQWWEGKHHCVLQNHSRKGETFAT